MSDAPTPGSAASSISVELVAEAVKAKLMAEAEAVKAKVVAEKTKAAADRIAKVKAAVSAVAPPVIYGAAGAIGAFLAHYLHFL